MQLREDLLKLSNENELFQKGNYQYKIENEDLRDRLNLLGEERGGINIEYIPYIPVGQVERACDEIDTPEQLRESKIFIFNHIFSLQKENRALLRRIKTTTEHRHKKSNFHAIEESLAEEKTLENSLLALKALRSQTTMSDQDAIEEPTQSRFGFSKPVKKTKLQKFLPESLTVDEQNQSLRQSEALQMPSLRLA